MIYEIKTVINAVILTVFSLLSVSALALDVNITQNLPSLSLHYGDDLITIKRIQDQDNVLTGGYTKTSRKCPPFCIQPLHVAPGVTTVAELELLEFIDKKVEMGRGVLIDARTASWHSKGTIPGSINIPFNHFDPELSERELVDVLMKLSVRKKRSSEGSIWDSIKSVFAKDANAASNSPFDFSKAKEVVLWCNGMWCGQSPRAIKNLLTLGYPPKKIFYYRGGMQAWQSLGLTVVIPE